MNTKTFNYNRAEVKSGILHFGVGNFHRAHLQEYTNDILNKSGDLSWGICGAMLMPQDKALFDKLSSQEGRYSLTVCGRDGKNESHWIGSLVELMWLGDGTGDNGREAIINKVANKDIKIITLTITEGGYNLDNATVQGDIKNPQSPNSVFGIVAEGLRRRIAAGNGAVTILSCDNLQHNGDTCKKVFEAFFKAQDAELAAWVSANVTFPNSMVDRITPATTPADVDRINATLAERDEAPVYCEDYIQWVVEDNFAAGRPAWEEVGVEFTSDVAPFENMKLSLLNASHTLLSYPSILGGHRKVDEAMRDTRIVKFVEDFMNLDVTPYVPAPANTDLTLYKKILVERFANSSVSDQVQRLCGDGASKFPVYVMPIAAKMVAGDDDMVRIAYLIAAYRHYLKYRMDDKGESFDIFEPQITAQDQNLIMSDNAIEFLAASPFSAVKLAASSKFVALYESMVEQIKSRGAMVVLESII
ncbi:MAG: mannitol dehydrogenase family protein [Rikenellaceae bacterium]